MTWVSFALLACVCFFQKGDTAITWTNPSATTGGTQTIAEDQALDTTITTFAATTDGTGGTAVTFSLATAVAPFAVAGTGELTITAALDFETTPSYTLEIQGVDNADTIVTSTATITVSVTDVGPTFSNTPYTPCVVHNSGADTAVLTVTATPVTSDATVTYTVSGTDFKIVAATGVITVNTDVTLDKADSPYTFDVTATEGSETTTTTVTVTVADTCDSAVGIALSMMALLAALFVHMF